MAPGIVIVEDNAMLRHMFVVFLRHKVPTMPIYACTRGAEARGLCAQVEMRCVLLDYALPDMDGVTLAADLIARWPQMAVLLLTGQTAPRMHRDAYQAGCVGVLVKPVSLDTLWETLQPLLTTDRRVLPLPTLAL